MSSIYPQSGNAISEHIINRNQRVKHSGKWREMILTLMAQGRTRVWAIIIIAVGQYEVCV